MTVSVDVWLRGTEHATTKTIEDHTRFARSIFDHLTAGDPE